MYYSLPLVEIRFFRISDIGFLYWLLQFWLTCAIPTCTVPVENIDNRLPLHSFTFLTDNMGISLPANYVPLVVTKSDLIVASLAWGFTLGFGFLTVWTAIKQTRSAWRRKGTLALESPYLWMIWGEIIASLCFGIIVFMYLLGCFDAR